MNIKPPVGSDGKAGGAQLIASPGPKRLDGFSQEDNSSHAPETPRNLIPA